MLKKYWLVILSQIVAVTTISCIFYFNPTMIGAFCLGSIIFCSIFTIADVSTRLFGQDKFMEMFINIYNKHSEIILNLTKEHADK